MSRKTITVTCDYCGKSYEKAESEYKRNQKLGRRSFCSRSCQTKANNADRRNKPLTKAQLDHLESVRPNRRDKYTPFRYSLRCAKRRTKECTITLENLEEVWNLQQGICPYTGIKLVLPEDSNIDTIPVYERASLDRINSSLGYVKGNIQFVSTPINYMKNTMSDSETKQFLKLISSYTSNLKIVTNFIE